MGPLSRTTLTKKESRSLNNLLLNYLSIYIFIYRKRNCKNLTQEEYKINNIHPKLIIGNNKLHTLALLVVDNLTVTVSFF